MKRLPLALLALTASLVGLLGHRPLARAEEEPSTWREDPSLSYEPPPSPDAPDPMGDPRIDDAALAWRTGQPTLARDLARAALSAHPEHPRARLVEAAIRTQLDPAIVLALDPLEQRASLEEFEAIGAQHLHAHVVGIVSAGIGLVGVLVSIYLPTLVDSSCFTPACEENRTSMRASGSLVGVLGLIGGAVGIGLHVDAGARWGRWADGLRVSVSPGSLALRF